MGRPKPRGKKTVSDEAMLAARQKRAREKMRLEIDAIGSVGIGEGWLFRDDIAYAIRLGELPHPRSVIYLRALLLGSKRLKKQKNTSARVRETACESLARLAGHGFMSAAKALREAAEKDPNESVRAFAQKKLARLNR